MNENISDSILKLAGAMAELSSTYRSRMNQNNWKLARFLHAMREQEGAGKANDLIRKLASGSQEYEALSLSKLQKLLIVGSFSEADLEKLGLAGITTDDLVDAKPLLLEKKTNVKRSDEVGRRAWEMYHEGRAVQSIRDRLKREGLI